LRTWSKQNRRGAQRLTWPEHTAPAGVRSQLSTPSVPEPRARRGRLCPWHPALRESQPQAGISRSATDCYTTRPRLPRVAYKMMDACEEQRALLEMGEHSGHDHLTLVAGAPARSSRPRCRAMPTGHRARGRR
jgi:hypothetical protein